MSYPFQTPAARSFFLLALLLGISSTSALAQYNTTSAKDILTQNDGLPCEPQKGSWTGYYNSGCCGSPGNRACAYILHFGKGPWGDSPGCTDPDANYLRWNSYDSKLLCNLAGALPEVPANLILPAAKPAVRDFRFFVTSDLHFYRISYAVSDQVEHPSRLNLANLVSSIAGKPYSAVIIPGDLTTGPNEQRLAGFRTLWERSTLPGATIGLPVFFGLGNHDASALPDGFGAEATDAKRMWEYLDTRMSLQHIDTSITGCLPYIDPGCLSFGASAGSHNYSWDWQGVHMVMLNTWAGDTDRAYSPPLGMNGLNWLKRDLEYYVGNTNRPVVLFQHYTLRDASANFSPFTAQNLTDFVDAIKKYNVVGLFSGHTHGLDIQSRSSSVNQPITGSDSGPGTRLDNFVDGSGGDCHGDADNVCSTATANFLSVAFSDKYMDVTANSWTRGTPTYVDSAIGFPGPAGGDSGTCRKRLANSYIDISSRVQISIANGAKKVTVVNNSGAPITGALAVQFPRNILSSWDFVDSCSVNGNPYVVLTEGSMANGQSLTISFNAANNINSVKVFQLADSLVSSDPSPVADGTVKTLQVASLSGDAVPFSYKLDAYTSGDPTQWLKLSVDKSTTPATFSYQAQTLPSYSHAFASFTVTPTDTTIAPITVPVTLSPATLNVTSNVPYAKFRFEGTDTSLPYNTVLTPGSVRKIDVVTPQEPLPGIRYVFKKWSNDGPALQNLNIPLGGLSLTATFDTYYKINTSLSPSAGGTMVFSPDNGPQFFLAGNLHVKATPNPGYYFTGYTGDLTGANPDLDFNLRSPLNVTANFAPNPTFSVTSNVPAAEGSTATLNGTTSPVTASLKVAPLTLVNISVPASFASATTPGIRYIFQQWSDGVTTAQRNFNAGQTSLTFTAQYDKQYLVNVSASPAGAGSVSGGAWYSTGGNVSLQATALAGFQFQQFTGTRTSSANPFSFVSSQPDALVANFGVTGTPQLYAAAAGAASDVAVGGQTLRALPLTLRNAGPGGAIGAQIDSITAIQVVVGTGTVTAALPGPAVAGNLPVNATGAATVNLNWPATASRIRLTVNFSANGGAYRGSTILNLFR